MARWRLGVGEPRSCGAAGGLLLVRGTRLESVVHLARRQEILCLFLEPRCRVHRDGNGTFHAGRHLPLKPFGCQDDGGRSCVNVRAKQAQGLEAIAGFGIWPIAPPSCQASEAACLG